MRTIKRKIKAQKISMGQIDLDQALPYGDIQQVDPFLLIHHWKDEFKGGQNQMDVGVGPHPHRGFSPVTLIFNGSVHHRDSAGYDSVVDAGGTQWMNSGKGIIHSERPSKEIAENGGLYEIIQFWVNAPAAHKLDDPQYQAMSADKTPFVFSNDEKVKTSVIAGSFRGVTSPIKTYSPMIVLRMEFNGAGKIHIPVPEDFNALVYVLEGNLTSSNETIDSKMMAIFNNDDKNIELSSKSNAKAILLSGQPINEKLATYGPFVMNNSREIINALQDYQEGKMGELIEDFV